MLFGSGSRWTGCVPYCAATGLLFQAWQIVTAPYHRKGLQFLRLTLSFSYLIHCRRSRVYDPPIDATGDISASFLPSNRIQPPQKRLLGHAPLPQGRLDWAGGDVQLELFRNLPEDVVPLRNTSLGALKVGRNLIPFVALFLGVVVFLDQGKEETVLFGGPGVACFLHVSICSR